MAHDPRGKVSLPLRDGVRGWAEFSECGRYRTVLGREWGDEEGDNYIQWIGMNPSTADANVNDPTITKLMKYTEREGYYGLVVCNVMDYRATYPKDLLDENVMPVSPNNLPTILTHAQSASLTVVCFGRLHRRLAVHGRCIVSALRNDGAKLMCLGTNADGSPKHPLYVRDDAPLIPFE